MNPTHKDLPDAVIYKNEAEARKALDASIKEYDKVTEGRGIFTHICAISVVYYDEQGKPKALSKGGISGRAALAEELHTELGDLIALFKELPGQKIGN